MSEQDVVDRLDRLIAMYRLINAEPLAAAKTMMTADPLVKAILNACTDWIAAGTLKSTIAAANATSEKTVQRRTLELVESGVLLSKRDGAKFFYKDSGMLS